MPRVPAAWVAVGTGAPAENRRMSNDELRITKDAEQPDTALRHSPFDILPFDKLMAQALSVAEGRFCGSPPSMPR